MRTTKRFTKTTLARFERTGRGTGTLEDYLAWHRVTRGDPASMGRSHILKWRNRLRDLLSDGELGSQFFSTMLPNLADSLEQYKLAAEPDVHPRIAYGEDVDGTLYEGTLQIAASLGLKHPKLRDEEKTTWIMTTDLLLAFREPGGKLKFLAVSFKSKEWDEGNVTKRTRQLLSIEKEYWRLRGVEWILVTPALADERVVLTLRRTACWGLAPYEASAEMRKLAVETVKSFPWYSVTDVLKSLAQALGEMSFAQHALWQAIWKGELHVDLRRGWRPHEPLRPLTEKEFWDLNPIHSRRSSWK